MKNGQLILKLRPFGYLIGLMCCSLANGFPQTSGNLKGLITGQVTERTSGQSVAGAKISAKNGVEIEPGVHDIAVSASGFAPLVKNQIDACRFSACGLNFR